MLTFNIIQYKKSGKKDIVLFWDETKILEQLLCNSPNYIRGELKKAWDKTLKDFKGETRRL